MGVGLPELLVILLIAFLVFGAKRLPELGSGLGKAIRDFNKGLKGEDGDSQAQKPKDDGPKSV
jgi:sec-independent protein translocase protein TatA